MELTLVMLLLMASVVGECAAGRSVEVEIPGVGSVHGLRQVVLGKPVDVYLGIPYAIPPIGERRFKPPEPVPRWNISRDGTRRPKACMQLTETIFSNMEAAQMWAINTAISEDCLYLNIWRPTVTTKEYPAGIPATGKAVMIWIHGGGFTTGTSTLDLFDGAILAKKADVVVVSMQYRLGPFGFLSLGTSRVPGNAGLLDQHLAVKWVSDHIQAFGGDSHRIALFGESAGSASVHFHLSSPLSRDLFQTAILQSGAATAIWAFHSLDEAKQSAFRLATRVGCMFPQYTGDEYVNHVTNCLKKISAKELSEAQYKLPNGTEQQSLRVDRINILPTIDGYFLPEYPVINTADTNKSIIIGFTKDEGSLYLLMFFPEYFLVPFTTDLNETEYMTVIRKALALTRIFSEDIIEDVAAEYANSSIGAMVHRDAIKDILSDVFFKCSILDLATSYADHGGDVYMYQFNHRTSANKWPQWMGVMHGYEIDHVFGRPFDEPSAIKYKNEEKYLSEQVMTYWTNLAKTTDPNMNEDKTNVQFTWPKYTSTTREILLLDTSQLAVTLRPRNKPCQLWKDVLLKLGPCFPKCLSGAVSNFYKPTIISWILLLVILK